MSTIDDLARDLGADVMKAMDETGDDRLFMEVAKVIGAASQTLEEAFLTDIRVRLAERAGRQFLAQRLGRTRQPRPAEVQSSEGAAASAPDWTASATAPRPLAQPPARGDAATPPAGADRAPLRAERGAPLRAPGGQPSERAPAPGSAAISPGADAASHDRAAAAPSDRSRATGDGAAHSGREGGASGRAAEPVDRTPLRADRSAPRDPRRPTPIFPRPRREDPPRD